MSQRASDLEKFGIQESDIETRMALRACLYENTEVSSRKKKLADFSKHRKISLFQSLHNTSLQPIQAWLVGLVVRAYPLQESFLRRLRIRS